MRAIFEIANSRCKLIAIPNSLGIADATKFSDPEKVESSRCKIEGQPILVQQIKWSPEACIMPACSFSGPIGDVIIEASSEKCEALSENNGLQKCMLKFDSADCSGQFINNSVWST